MKQNILLPGLAGLLLLFTAGCGDFGDINIDPNNPSQNDTRYLLIRAEQGVTGSVFSEGSPAPSTSSYNPWGQIFPQYMGEAQNVQYTGLNIVNSTGLNYYAVFLRNLKVIVDANNDEAQKSQPYVAGLGPNNDQIGIATTLKAFYMMTLVDTFGSMPYSEMLLGDEGNFTPVFDSVQDIYTALDTELKEVYGKMSSGTTVDGNFDILYGGDMSKWKKLNASIRMAMAIKLSDVDPATGKARFAAAYNDGGLASNADNFVYQYLDENNNASPIYYNYLSRKDFSACATLVDAFRELRDGRLIAYAKPNLDNETNVLTGIPFGTLKEDLVPFQGKISELADNLTRRDLPLVIISAAKVKLMAAEAAVRGWISADANTLYQDAIRLSFEEKEVGAIAASLGDVFTLVQAQNNLITDADEYLAQPAVQLTGSAAEKIEKIAYQRWLNGFMQDGVEAWSDWRRLNVPRLEVGEYAASNDVKHIPYRMVLSTDDWNQNKENYEKMVSAQGPNTVDTRIWWDVADNH